MLTFISGWHTVHATSENAFLSVLIHTATQQVYFDKSLVMYQNLAEIRNITFKTSDNINFDMGEVACAVCTEKNKPGVI